MEGDRGDKSEFTPPIERSQYVTVYMRSVDHQSGAVTDETKAEIRRDIYYGPTDNFRNVIGEVALANRCKLARKQPKE